MAVQIIIGSSFEKAHKFARETLGLQRSEYRLASSAMSLKGLPSQVTVHLAHDHMNRHDRFAVKSTLRFTKATVIDHSKPEPEILPANEPKHQTVKRGPGRPRKAN